MKSYGLCAAITTNTSLMWPIYNDWRGSSTEVDGGRDCSLACCCRNVFMEAVPVASAARRRPKLIFD